MSPGDAVSAGDADSRLEVLSPGPLTTIQDAGRPGHAHEGVSPSGWLDAPAAELANRLTGNAEGAAVLETTLSGPRLRLAGTSIRWIAVTGAPVSLRVGGRPAALYAPVAVAPGEEIEVGTAISGLRSYLAVSGGIAVDPVMNSRATDLLGGLGPATLARGQTLPLGSPGSPPAVSLAPPAPIESPATLAILPGPRADWLAEEALDTLTGETWTVSDHANRIGIRLAGARLRWREERELASEGMVCGSLEVPPNGEPVLLLADHPTTGGYPVLAVVVRASLPAAAQLRPGDSVRFRLV